MNGRRGASWAVAIILGFSLAAGGCGPVTGVPGGSAAGGELTETQKFSLKDLDGNVVSLAQVLTQKKLVLLNFWATWCAYCVEEMPDLVKLQAQHEAKGFTVLAVNVGESSRQAAAFSEKMGLNFPIVLDETNEVAQSYGIVGIPVSYLISSDGKIIGEYHGFTPRLVSDVEKNLEVRRA